MNTRQNPYTVGAVPPAPRRSRGYLLTRGMINVLFGAVMNALVRLVLTVWLLVKIWHAMPWPAAAYLTYTAVSLEAIVFALKTVWKRPR